MILKGNASLSNEMINIQGILFKDNNATDVKSCKASSNTSVILILLIPFNQ